MTLTAFFSALLGGGIAILGQIAVRYFNERQQRALDTQRKALLIKLLSPENMPVGKSGKKVEWRTFITLRDVIGADDDTAKRLLIEVGARGSTKGAQKWALIKNKPLDRSLDEESKDEVEERP